MKRFFLTTLFLLCLVASFAQGLTVMIVKNGVNPQTLVFKRGQDFIMPVYDNNARSVIDPSVFLNPKFSDLECLVDSLTDEGTLIPLTDVLRFSNSQDKEDFIEFCELAGAFVQENNIGDVVITDAIWNVFAIYEGYFDTILQQATYVERLYELQDAGLIPSLTFPTENTPLIYDCN